MKWFTANATIEIMHQPVWGCGRSRFLSLTYIWSSEDWSSVSSLYCHYRRYMPPSSIWFKSTEFTCLPVWSLSAVLCSPLSSCLTSFNLIQSCFLSWRVFFSKEKCNFTLIKIPSPPSFIPSENDISQMSIRPCYMAPLTHKEAQFYLFGETFQQCGHVSNMLFGKRSLERLYKCVMLSAPGGCFSFPLHKQAKRCGPRRCNCPHVFMGWLKPREICDINMQR